MEAKSLRTISVREAAAALAITPRAVTYRLEKGQLKGVMTKNEFGVPEWRIYPNKEISKGLGSIQSQDEPIQTNFAPDDVVDAVSIDPAASEVKHSADVRSFGAEIQAVVEQCVKPLVDEVKAQALALAEKDRIIEEQRRQLRLLPDFQRQAESERKAAELKALEAEALKKQVDALEEERVLADERATTAVTEMVRLQAEKEEQGKAIRQELETLQGEIKKLKEPWWKKMLNGSGTDITS